MEQQTIISTEKRDSCTVVTIEKKVLREPEDADQLLDEVRPYLEDASTSMLVINFQKVVYINTNILAVALEWSRESDRLNTPIRFCNISDDVYQPMLITRVAMHFLQFPSVEDAIAGTKVTK